MSRFRAVIFDLDGTLLDTIEDIADAMNAVLRRAGFPGHAPESYARLVGDGLEHLVLRAVPPGRRDAETVARCVEGMRREYAAGGFARTKPYPGVPGLLDALSARGCRLAVLTNKPHESACEHVSGKLGRWHFNLVLGARPGVPLKPDPAAAIEISAALGIPPRGFVFLGDSGIDMDTARLAGMHPAGALWGFRGREELVQHGAVSLLEKPADLLALFRRCGDTR